MWFRNLCVYQLADGFHLEPEGLEEKLQAGVFHPVGGHDPESRGAGCRRLCPVARRLSTPAASD